jgi:hypothetical protein
MTSTSRDLTLPHTDWYSAGSSSTKTPVMHLRGDALDHLVPDVLTPAQWTGVPRPFSPEERHENRGARPLRAAPARQTCSSSQETWGWAPG